MSQAILDRRRAGTPEVGGWSSTCFGVASVAGSFEEVEERDVEAEEEEERGLLSWMASIVLSDVNSAEMCRGIRWVYGGEICFRPRECGGKVGYDSRCYSNWADRVNMEI